MMGSTHFSMALASGLFFRLDPGELVVFCIGSMFPDKIDFFICAGNKDAWKRLHRTYSHSWWLIALFFAISYMFFTRYTETVRPELYVLWKLIPFFFIGMFFHVFCDAFTPAGIPLMSPTGTRHGFGLVSSRGMGNSLLFFAGIAVSVYLLWNRYLDGTDLSFSLRHLFSRFFAAM